MGIGSVSLGVGRLGRSRPGRGLGEPGGPRRVRDPDREMRGGPLLGLFRRERRLPLLGVWAQCLSSFRALHGGHGDTAVTFPRAPHRPHPREPAPHRAQAVLEGKQAGRINQISTVSQMIRFCTCFPETR